MIEPPKKRKLSQTPFEIVETNRIPILIGAAVFVIALGFLMYKTQSKHKQEITEDRPKQRIELNQKEDVRQWFQDDKYADSNYNVKKIIAQAVPKTPQEVQQQIMTNEESNFKKQVTDGEYAVKVEIEKLKEKQEVEAKKMEILASTSPMNVEVSAPPAVKKDLSLKAEASSDDSSNDPLNQITKSLKMPTGGDGQSADLNNQDEKRSFIKERDDNGGDYLKYSLQSPKSPYEVQAGAYIHATLVGGVNSDVPGPVTALVSSNVYDSVTGNYILIPQGSRLIGTYDSKVSYGQNRAIVVWTRLIFPSGKSIDLNNMQGVDISGFAGLHDKVNNHFWRIYGNALLLSFMGAGYDLLNNQQSNNTGAQTPQQVVASNVAQKMSDVASQSIQKNMDVQPTIIIDPGTRFNVIVMNDMVLEPIDDVERPLSYTR